MSGDILIPDLPKGPLDFYRNKSSFDFKKLKLFLGGEETIDFENKLCKILQSNKHYAEMSFNKTITDEREVNVRRFLNHDEITVEIGKTSSDFQKLKNHFSLSKLLTIFSCDSIMKIYITREMFPTVIQNLGTEIHEKFIKDAEQGKIIGCVCLTEIGHGSNTRNMRTTATYDPEKFEFVINSPDFQAAKCWAGNLSQTATHAIIYAQLYVNGEHHELNAFVFEIRDPVTHLPKPGITIGEMGEKLGINGLDNGFIIFNNFRVPKSALLNRLVDVKDDGSFITRTQSNREKYEANFRSLLYGRLNIPAVFEMHLVKAVTIAVRYAAVRKQFSLENGSEEVPILEYQSHQYKLFPYLAGSFALRFLSNYLVDVRFNKMNNTEYIKNGLNFELHGITSGIKPVVTWFIRDAITECREACGGFGYLKSGGFVEIKRIQDANVTFEGENHLLIMQTSNWLLKQWPKILEGQTISTPLGSIDFLTNSLEILKHKFKPKVSTELFSPDVIIDAFQWLTVYNLKRMAEKFEVQLKQGRGMIQARNEVELFSGRNLSIAFTQHFILQTFLTQINHSKDEPIKRVLYKLFYLYGIWNLGKFIPILYEGRYCEESTVFSIIEEATLKLLDEIKNDAVALVDAISPPDLIINSDLGSSDGQVYERLEKSFKQNPLSGVRPFWWHEIAQNLKTKNKL